MADEGNDPTAGQVALTVKPLMAPMVMTQELLADWAFEGAADLMARKGLAELEGAEADRPALAEPDEALSGLCDRCGEEKDDTDWFGSWKGRLEICTECWSDTGMEE